MNDATPEELETAPDVLSSLDRQWYSASFAAIFLVPAVIFAAAALFTLVF